jgi:hypothetical protein
MADSVNEKIQAVVSHFIIVLRASWISLGSQSLRSGTNINR